MADTLSDGTTTITLPDDLVWIDEYKWSGIVQRRIRALDGSLIVQEASVQASSGRLITLSDGGDSGWMSRSELDALLTLSNQVDKVFTLIYNTVTYQVRFRRSDSEELPIIATPVIPCKGANLYRVTLNLIAV
jgi:hypothetical protein